MHNSLVEFVVGALFDIRENSSRGRMVEGGSVVMVMERGSQRLGGVARAGV